MCDIHITQPEVLIVSNYAMGICASRNGIMPFCSELASKINNRFEG